MKLTGLKGHELLNAIVRHKENEKWGKFDFKGVDIEGRKGFVVVDDSFEAKKYGLSRSPVCHFVRGYVAGALAILFRRDVVLEEGLCLLRGDNRCEFHIRSLL